MAANSKMQSAPAASSSLCVGSKIYKTFPDISGSPGLLLRADIPTDISRRGKAALGFALISILVAGVAVATALLVLSNAAIVKPIRELTEHAMRIGKSDDLKSLLQFNRNDEIGTLASEFNDMVSKLSAARNQLIEESYRSGKADMAAGVMHNVRNGLNSVLGSFSMIRAEFREIPVDRIDQALRELKNGVSDEKRAENLRQYSSLHVEKILALVESSGGRMDELFRRVEHIELILREQEGQSNVAPPKEQTELIDLVESARDLLSENQRINVSFEIDASVAGTGSLKISRVILLQVLSNIFINSADSFSQNATEGGRITISSAVEQDQNAERIHMQICDNGVGIASENLIRIFERGYTTKGSDHAGIGLHWCANTIIAMNGRLYAESDGIGAGACFHLIIPKE